RHLTHILNGVEARTRLLVTLSDGRPDDFSDNYRGDYGIEDTRQALLEAHRSGIKPFCITIDREARDYLPHMYGAVSWTLVQEVAKLPARLRSPRAPRKAGFLQLPRPVPFPPTCRGRRAPEALPASAG